MKRKAKRAKKTRAVVPYKRTASRVRQEVFIKEYIKQYGNKAEASRVTGIPYDTVMKWLKNPKFIERMQMAEEQLYDHLHAAAFNRAGVASDALAMFFLRKMKPELFDDKIRQMKHAKDNELTDPDAAQPITINFVTGEPPERIKKEREEQGS
jgi:hypothetical protein